MAERLKEQLLETDKMVDLVAGPGMYVVEYFTLSIYDVVLCIYYYYIALVFKSFHSLCLDSYRDLPRMLSVTATGQAAG